MPLDALQHLQTDDVPKTPVRRRTDGRAAKRIRRHAHEGLPGAGRRKLSGSRTKLLSPKSGSADKIEPAHS